MMMSEPLGVWWMLATNASVCQMRALEGSFVHIDNRLDFRSHHIGWHAFASRSGSSEWQHCVVVNCTVRFGRLSEPI